MAFPGRRNSVPLKYAESPCTQFRIPMLGVTGVCPPGVERGQGALALDAVTLLLVADFLARLFVEGLQQVEGDVGGLEVFGVGVGDVVDQRAESGGAGNGRGLLAVGDGGGVKPGQQAGGDGFGVAFDAGELAGEEHAAVPF